MKFPEIKKPNFPDLSRKQVFSLLVFLFILIALPVAVFLVQQQQIYWKEAVGPEARPINVQIANLHGDGFSVSWVSVHPTTGVFQETTGSVFWGTDQNNPNQEVFDDRGQDISSTTHHVSIFNLNSNTTYYFKIKSGPDLYGKSEENWLKGGLATQQATPPELALSGNPQPIYGYIKNQTGNKIADALVYVRLKKDDSETKSALMSTVTKTNEGWVMDVKNTREEDLGSSFNFDDNDQVLIDVQVAQNEIVSTNFIVSNSSPAPDIIVTLPEQASALKFTSQNIVGGNAYTYWKTLDDTTMLSTGDILEYDVYLETNVAGIGGIDLRFTSSSYARDVSGWVDQNNLSCHPTANLVPYAYGQWFHRQCKVPAGLNGKVIDWIDLVNELDANTAISAYYDNFIIKNNSGTVKNTIHTQGDPDYNLVDFKNNSSNTGNVVQTTTPPTTLTPTATPIPTSTATPTPTPSPTPTPIPTSSGSSIQFVSQNIAGGNAYTYWKTLDDATTLTTGDTFEYDVYLTNSIKGIGSIDIRFTDNTYARDVSGWVDQNNLSCHPAADLTSYAYGKWFHRTCKIPSGLNGKVIDWIDLVNENNSKAIAIAHYGNFIIKTSSGAVKTTIHTQGDPDYNLVDFKNNSSNTGNVVQFLCF